jgi:hypothetical protein
MPKIVIIKSDIRERQFFGASTQVSKIIKAPVKTLNPSLPRPGRSGLVAGGSVLNHSALASTKSSTLRTAARARLDQTGMALQDLALRLSRDRLRRTLFCRFWDEGFEQRFEAGIQTQFFTFAFKHFGEILLHVWLVTH